MRLRRLRVECLRRIDCAELSFGEGIHWLLGANGSGKSSLLEAVSLLASGRSFRGGSVEACIQRGAEALTAYAEIGAQGEGLRRVGLRRAVRGPFELRVDGQDPGGLAGLFRAFPAVVLPADTGALIAGPGELRRRFLDWGLFHVEQSFYPLWQRYSRALRQRNLLLRRRETGAVEQAWREELAGLGESLHALRHGYLDSLRPQVDTIAAWLLPQLGAPQLAHLPGWPAQRESLADALSRSADSDRRLGFTSVGPHRAGWQLGFEHLPQREMFSRGQAKLGSLLMLLAQVAQFSEARGEPPILGLDDALAELDAAHQQRLLAYLRSLSVQALLASADEAAVARLARPEPIVFHVEQGKVVGPL